MKSESQLAYEEAITNGDYEAADHYAELAVAEESQPQAEEQQGGYQPTLNFAGYDTGVEVPQWLNDGLAGAGRKMMEIGTLGAHEPNEAVAKSLDENLAANVGSGIVDVGAMLGGGGVLKGMGAVPKIGKGLAWLGQGLTAPANAIQAGTSMGIYGAATNPDRMEGAIAGGAGGAAGHALVDGAARIINPAVSGAVKGLLEKGVPLTTGQRLGGVAKKLEEKAVSIPLVGDLIGSRHKEVVEAYARNVIDDALKPIGAAVPKVYKTGRESMNYANKQISKEYDEVLEQMPIVADDIHDAEIANLRNMAKSLPPKEAAAFEQIISTKLDRALDNPTRTILGNTYKGIMSDIRTQAKKAQKSPGYYETQLGDALMEAHRALRAIGERQHPDLAKRLANTDMAYAQARVIDGAGSMLGAADGSFSPAQLLNSIKANAGKKRFAEGSGFNQTATEQAKGVISPTVNNSGTADRLLVAALAGAGAAVDPVAAGSVLAGSALYSKAGQGLLNAALFKRPQGAGHVRDLLQGIAPTTGLLGSAAALNTPQENWWDANNWQ